MVVENKKSEKLCSFYVSDFHLEMILVPYINKKIEENERVIIATEKDLEETVKVLISKLNLKEENKEKILKLKWNKSEISQIEKIKKNSNIIVIGTESYIKKTNDYIRKINIDGLNIVDCYNFNEIKDNINNIINEYDKNLNTLGTSDF